MPSVDERCLDCGAVAPEVSDEQTLRSTSGWRISFVRAPDGTTQQVWRCPTCAEKKETAKQPPKA